MKIIFRSTRLSMKCFNYCEFDKTTIKICHLFCRCPLPRPSERFSPSQTHLNLLYRRLSRQQVQPWQPCQQFPWQPWVRPWQPVVLRTLQLQEAPWAVVNPHLLEQEDQQGILLAADHPHPDRQSQNPRPRHLIQWQLNQWYQPDPQQEPGPSRLPSSMIFRLPLVVLLYFTM